MRMAGIGITVVTPRPIEVIGQDLLDEFEGPCVFWAVDGTAEALRSGLRAAGWRGRLRVVAPVPGQVARRRGPSVALLVDDPQVASAHLTQLMPVPVVPIWFGGAHSDRDELRVRIGAALTPAVGEQHASFTARVCGAADALAVEEQLGWWPVIASAGGPTSRAGAHTVRLQMQPGGWRQRWARTEPLADSPRIWS